MRILYAIWAKQGSKKAPDGKVEIVWPTEIYYTVTDIHSIIDRLTDIASEVKKK